MDITESKLNLSASNIAWQQSDDEKMYLLLSQNAYKGIEIAPTRLFPIEPYSHLTEAKEWATRLYEQYGLRVASMQSIWYGREENIFRSARERQVLTDYTRKAICFAESIGCKNLVFGCPRNRATCGVVGYESIAIDFFATLGEMAAQHNTCIAIEPNPIIYNTDFLNTTAEVVSLLQKINVAALRLNADLGAMIYNNESYSLITDNLKYVNHIHISEPGLAPVYFTEQHSDFLLRLSSLPYEGYVSIEMKYDKENGIEKIIKRLSRIGNFFI